MKKFILFSFCLFSLSAIAVDTKTYAEAISKKRDVLVLCVGSDWMKDATLYIDAFKNAARAYSGEVCFAIYDRKASLSDEEIAALGELPSTIYGYPALVYRDLEGRPVFQQERIPLSVLPKLPPLATRTSKLRVDRDLALKAARAKKNSTSEDFSKALDILYEKVLTTYSQRTQKEYLSSVSNVVEEMKMADPKDHDGFVLRYSFDTEKIADEILSAEITDARVIVSDYLLKRALLPQQRQRIYALLFAAEFAEAGEEGELDRALQALRDAIAQAPHSPLAEALRRRLAYHSDVIELSQAKWFSRMNRPRFQKARFNCSQLAKVGGLYKITFRAQQGETLFRNVRFVGAGIGKEVESGVWECRFKGEDRAVLEFELKGTGDFTGAGEIEIVKIGGI